MHTGGNGVGAEVHEKLSDLIGEAIWLLIDHHSGSVVEIPSKNRDRLLSASGPAGELKSAVWAPEPEWA